MSKIAQINEIFLEELAIAINREITIPNTLITITYVDCSPDLQQAKVGFSVLPDNLTGTALRHLTEATSQLVNILKKRTRFRKIPHFIWQFDATEKEAEKIEKLITEAADD